MNKTAIITGATSGIGASFAKLLAFRCYDLIITGRRKEKIQKLADELSNKFNTKTEVIIAELSNEKDITELINQISKMGKIDVLINNAGYSIYKNYSDTTVTEIEKIVSVQIVAVTKLISAVLPKMIKQGYGNIINVSSLGAILPIKKDAAYCGTKSFLNTFSESLYMEVKEKGIKVQALCPGFTKTDFHSKLKMNASERENMGKFKLMSANEVAEYSLESLKSNKVICIPGYRKRMIAKLISILPKSFYYKMLEKY
ncbi:SDR family oxidoreductase [uncultured Draconibacterium sp.]|uniref:SDR family NAD(P)-dependent oxidoreductase n=1 Tax=uncultured Draconibacterium sp. TaxID=1573823 RepID=UPI003217A94A